MSSTNKKAIFWLIGVLLSAILYFFIMKLSFFNFINHVFWLPLFIILIIIILFAVVGIIVSKIPFEILFDSKKLKFNDLDKKVQLISKKKDVDNFAKNLRNILNYVAKDNYSKKSIKMLRNFVGIDRDDIIKLIKATKKLKIIKLIYWTVGFVLCILNYILIIILPYFEILENIWFLPFSISLVIFILFFAEGLLAVRMPTTFYLSLLNLNVERYFENQKKIIKKSDVLLDYKKQKNVTINRIKNTVAYLKKINLKEEDIEKLLNKEGFSKKTSKELIKYSNNRIKNNFNIGNHSSDKVLELFLAKLHEEFLSLKDVYSQLNQINIEIQSIKENQKQLESLRSKRTLSKNTKSIKNKVSSKIVRQNKVRQNKVSNVNKNNNTKNQVCENKKLLDNSKNNILDSNSNKLNLNKNINSDFEFQKHDKYNELIGFLYELLLPYAQRYTKKEISSFLLSEKYKPSVVDDVIDKFKENKVSFSSKSKPLSEKFVYFINNIYNKIAKNN